MKALRWLVFMAICNGVQAQSPTTIYLQPQDQAVAAGYPLSLFVMITNTTPPFPAVQWLKASQPIPKATNSFVSQAGPSRATYTINNAQPTNAGSYSVVLSNSAGVVTSRVATVIMVAPATFITMAGSVQSGTNDGLGTAAAFNSPRHVAVDAAGNLFVTDFYNSTVRKITPSGMVSTVAGLPGVAGTNDGYGSNARFVLPHGIALDRSGNLFVTDFGFGWTNGAIRKISPDGLVTTIAGSLTASGTNDGPGNTALFCGPMGIVVDDDNLFVSDGFNYTIRKLTRVGTNWEVSTIAGLPGIRNQGLSSFTDGTNSEARFGLPDGLAVDQGHNVFIADEGYPPPSSLGAIRKITPVGTNWVVSTIIGATGFLPGLSAVAVDTNGYFYVASQGIGCVKKVIPLGTNWVAATIAGYQPGTIVNGTGISNSFDYPHGIALDQLGNIYVVDDYANVALKGWSSDSSAACVLNPPQFSPGQVQLGVLVQTGTPTNFTLLQADQLSGSLTTNNSWLLTTNIPGLSYGVTTPTDGSPFRFYRLQY